LKNIKTNPVQTVLTITVGLIVVYLVTDIRWILLSALIIGAIGIFSPFLSKQIDYLWMKLAWVLSLIVPNILLSIVFYLFLFPIALLSRLSRKDELMIKKQQKTLFRNRTQTFDKAYFEKTW